MADTDTERESLLTKEAMQTVLGAGDLQGMTIILRILIVGRNGAHPICDRLLLQGPQSVCVCGGGGGGGMVYF